MVLCAVGALLQFDDVLVGDETDQVEGLVHHGQLLDLELLKDLLGPGKIGVRRGGDQVLARHHFGHRARHLLLEPQVAVGNDAHQAAVGVDHGNAADAVLGHQFQGIAHQRTFLQGNGVLDHAALAALHPAHFGGLFGDRLVLVHHADPALLRDRDGELRAGDRIHGRAHDGHVQADVPAEVRAGVHLTGQHFAVCRHEQYIIVRQPFTDELVAREPVVRLAEFCRTICGERCGAIHARKYAGFRTPLTRPSGHGER